MSTAFIHSELLTGKSNNPNVPISKTAWINNHVLSGGTNKGDRIFYDPTEATHIGIGLAPIVNARDYGVAGDGADYTTEVRAAITAMGYASVYNQPLTGLHNVCRGTLLLPAGTIKITDSLPYVSGLTVQGMGINTEILFYPTGSAKQLFAPGTNYFFDTTPYSHAYINFRDLMLYGYGAYAQDGLYLDGVSFSTIMNVVVTGFTRYGIYFGDSHLVGAYYNQIIHPHLLNNGVNLHVAQGANALHVSGGRIRDTLGTPEYLVELNGISTCFDGVAFEGAPTIATIHDKGVGTSIINYYEENSGSGVFIHRDASLNSLSGLTIVGGSGVSQMVKYENFDLTAALEQGDSRPDNLGLGSPVNVPIVSNPAFRYGLYNWTHYFNGLTTDDVESIDTTYIFNSPASLKMVHAANTGEAGVYQDVNLTSYQCKQIYMTAVVKFTGTDWPDLYIQLDSFGRSKHLHPIIDFGNGWQLWMTSFNVTSASGRVTIGFTQSGATCYVGLVQLWTGGIPQIPTETNKDEEFKATSAPATGVWPVGKVVWKSDAAGGGTPGWVNTATGFKAMGNLGA